MPTHSQAPPATDPLADPPADFRVDSPARWFTRGLAAGVMLMAAVNAVSYFIRSSAWNSLLGKRADANERIGFPWVMWEGGNSYEGLYVDYPMLGLNALIGLLVGVVVGGIVALYSDALNGLIGRDGGLSSMQRPRRVQFSLQGLMIATGLVALLAMLATRFADRRETLLAIYLLGPVVLVGVAMLPRRLSWQSRVWIIVPTTLCLIAAAIGVGMNLRIEFDRVLLAIFLCWTPQSALAATALTVWLLWSIANKRNPSEASSVEASE